MSHSYNNQMVTSVHPRLDNLLASLSLNLAEESQTALERAAGLAGSATVALLALEEILGEAHVGRIAEVLGLTHSGAVRLVTQLEREGLAERRTGADRRRVEVRLTPAGRRRAREARAARDAVVQQATGGLTAEEATTLEGAAGQAGRGAGQQPDRTSQGRRVRRLLVPHLRLRRLRPARGPLPGPGHGREGVQSLGWPRGHPDHAEHPQRRLRAARRGGRPDRQRRLGARRRDGQPLRAQPDLRPGHGRGADASPPTYLSTRT